MMMYMRSGFGFTLLITFIFASSYFYFAALAICPVPVYYRIGELDERFGLTLEEARAAVADAELVWEQPTGRELFIYDEQADFTVNFIYDERQAFTEAEEASRERLAGVEEVNDTLMAQYSALVEEYDELQVTYEAMADAYERDLVRYNETVASYNEEGGAPSEVFAELQAEEASLERDRRELETLRTQLNRLVDSINQLGEQGNNLVERYNERVATYNEQFGQSREFTQGTYVSSGRIDIYTFADAAELRLVLAHELGHALSIDHVPGTASIMYFLIGEQPEDLALSPEDLEEFRVVCGEGSFWDTIEAKLRYFFTITV